MTTTSYRPNIKTSDISSEMNGYSETSPLLTEKEPSDKTLNQEIPEKENSSRSSPVEQVRAPKRRADVDAIMIILTYGIYLFHLCRIYRPGTDTLIQHPDFTNTTRTEDPFTLISPFYIVSWFIGFMHVWNMPMFFYLSGQNTYSSLFRRSARQFREERVHRLLVPVLFMSVVVQFPCTLSYFAPHTTPLVEESYWEYARKFYRRLGLHQAWFLVYLFIFSQIFVCRFVATHPAHQTPDSTSCLSSLRQTPQEFVLTINWLLGGPVRFVLIPGFLIGILETTQNVIGGYIRAFPFLSYMVVYVLGYVTAAADTERILDNWSGWYLNSGLVLSSLYGVGVVQWGWGVIERGSLDLLQAAVEGFTRGLGQWLLITGCLMWTRTRYSEPREWHSRYRIIAMPFYLIHLQVIVSYSGGALWIPYIRTFPAMLLVTTFLSFSISYLITKSTNLRYFFGVPPLKDSWLPGKLLGGFVPVLVLAVLVGFHITLARTV